MSEAFLEADANDLRAIAAISPGKCVTLPGCVPKQFAKNIQGSTHLTSKQHAYLWSLVWSCRRQIQDKSLVTMAKQTIGGAK